MQKVLQEARATESESIRLFLEDPSEAAFTPLFRIFAPRLLRFFQLRGCRRPLAEDLTQDVMLAAYNQAANVRAIASFRAWVYGIGRNALLMHLRREGRSVEQIQLDALKEQLLAPPSVDPFSNSVLYESLSRLDPVPRQILILRYLDGLEYHEIAELLEMPLGTVQWKVFDSKRKLARWLNGESS